MSTTRERLSAALAAFICVAYASSLRDVALHRAVTLPAQVAPLPPPAAGEARDGSLSVEVTDERGALVEGARVSVFAMREERALIAGSFETDDKGLAQARALPRGDTWVLAEADGRQRASTRLELTAQPARLRLVLRKASRLLVQAIDEEQRAVVGATVEVRGGDPLPYAARTGDDGVAALGRLGPPPFAIKVSAPGYEPVTKTGVSPQLLPQRVVLRALASLEVSVVDEHGEPAQGATVLVSGPGLWPARSATTGEKGSVKIGGIPSGAYDVVASLGDRVSGISIGTPVRKGEPNRVKLELGQGRRVLVEVVDGEGDLARPVDGASVVLAEDGLSPFPREGVTGKDGRVLLGPVSDRKSVVSARAEGFVARTGVPVPPGLEGPLRVALLRGAVLSGRVVDGRDMPVDGATIEIIGVDLSGMPVDETPESIGFRAAHFAWALPGPQALVPAGELGVMPGPIPRIPHAGSVVPSSLLRAGGNEPPPQPWVSGVDGQFRAAPVPPGRLRALVRHPGYVEALSEAVSVGPGGEASVKVVMRLGGRLEGRLVDKGGKPVSAARIEIASSQGVVRSTVSADDGTFAFAAVPGEVTVTVGRPEAPEDVAIRKALSFAEGERREVELELPDAREPLTVRVLDDRGYPLDAVQATALSLEPASPLRETRFSRSDGVIVLPAVAGLRVRLELSLSGHAPVVRVLEPAGKELEVKLVPGTTASGEVTSRGGRDPLSGAEVQVFASQGVTRRARTDEQGRFTVRDLPAGPARIVVTHKGHARREARAVIPEPEAGRTAPLERVDLDESGAVEGEVVDPSGEPVIGARVAMGSVPAALSLGALPDGIVITDKQGRFLLPDLPEGEVELEAYAPERGRGRERGVKVVAGRTVRGVRITVDPKAGGADAEAQASIAVTLAESGPRGRRQIVIKHVAPGSEAENAGLREGDVVLSIDDRSPASLDEARKMLAGSAGDETVLRVQRGSEELPFRVPRERVRR